MLMRYLDDEHLDKKDGEPLPNREEWLYGGNNFSLSQLVSIEVFESMMNRRTASCFQQTTAIEIPEQDNGSDCGVFACQYAEALGVLRFPFDFSAIDMPTRRIKMVKTDRILRLNLRHFRDYKFSTTPSKISDRSIGSVCNSLCNWV